MVVTSSLVSSTLIVVITMAIAWVVYSKRQWKRRLDRFVQQHAQDKIYSPPGSTCSSSDPDILFIVCPASGGGKPMALYLECMDAFAKSKHSVRTYITKGPDDLSTLSERLDLTPFTAIAICAGDSSIYEFVQATLRKYNGKWPYAPILHLPGGLGNVVATECFGRSSRASDIILNGMNKTKMASVIQITSPGATTRFALHNTFDGAQRYMIEAIERGRASVLAACGETITVLLVFGAVLTMSRRTKPAMLTIVNSDTEGFGPVLGFGVSRFDNQMIVMRIDENPGPLELLKNVIQFFHGQIGSKYTNGEKLPDHISITIGEEYKLPPQNGLHYKFYCDGTSTLPIEGESMAFRVIPNAIPYFCFE